MTLAHRLFAGSALIVAVFVALLVLLSGVRLNHELRALETQRLAREARLVAAMWAGAPDAEAFATTAGTTLGHRVTLIDSTGRVVGDSRFDLAGLEHLENHATRPEVVEARRSGMGSALRTSPSRGDEELYVAVRAGARTARVSMSTRELSDVTASAQRDVLISGAVGLVVALLLSLAFARRVSRPIVELRDVARALAQGDLTRRPALAAAGEVGDLGNAVHRMAEQLAARMMALQHEEGVLAAVIESLHEGIVAVDADRRVVRLNRSARELLRLDRALPFAADLLPRNSGLRDALTAALGGHAGEREEIVVDGRILALTARPLGSGGAVLALFDLTETRRLESVRRDFVANASHELKTPLTVIGGYAETLVTDELPAEQRVQFIQTIRANAERMRRIVDDLLDLSRIESGGWTPHAVSVDVAALAADVLATAAAAALARGLRLTTAIDPDARTVRADPTALRQVLTNLVDNAVRYTPPDGTVTVFTETAPTGSWLGVRDSGIGIAPEHLPRIFERFYRVDRGRSRDEGGTGLGLAIVRHLAEAHGGRVEIQSEIGSGTVVRAFFPASPVTTL